MNIKDLVKDDNIATFCSYRNGYFYYIVSERVKVGESDFIPEYRDLQKYLFPIPLEDLGNATLSKHEKAILLMRYIRKAKEENTLVKVD